MKTPFLCQARSLLLAAVLPLLAAAASESPSLLLEKGIYAEEVEQNLDSAIKIYAQISAEAAASRSVVAQAQYRLAMCYQKKGDKEQAIKVLNDLSENPATDVGLSQRARERLIELGHSPDESIRILKIPIPATRWISDISADGRWICYGPENTDFESVVAERATGKLWTLQKAASRQEELTTACFSPDSRLIAHDIGEAAIYVANIDGSGARKVFPPPATNGKRWVTLEGWSGDSKNIIVANYDSANNARVATLVNVATGDAKTIASVPYYSDGHSWKISSNGKWLARVIGEYPNRKVTLFDFESGRDNVVAEVGPLADRVLGWAPDDASFLYVGTSAVGNVDLWSVAVKDGKPSGEPRLVRNDMGLASGSGAFIYPLRIIGDGSIYYSVVKTRPSQLGELWLMQGFLSKRAEAARSRTEIPLQALLGPDNSIHDRIDGFSATLPAGWLVRSAIRRENGLTSVQLNFPEMPKGASAALVSLATFPESAPNANKLAEYMGPKPPDPSEMEAYARRFATFRINEYQELARDGKSWGGRYLGRDASIVTRRLSERAVVSWMADFIRNNEGWVHYQTFVFGATGVVNLSLQMPAQKLDAVRPAWDRFVESVRLP